MYIIDKEKNRISKLEEKSFHELKFKERENLQEWIANNPSSLGEELLIIQKEFNGFGETGYFGLWVPVISEYGCHC